MAETASQLAGHRVALMFECRNGTVTGDGTAAHTGLPGVTFAGVAATSTDLAWIDPARLTPGGQRSLAAETIWQYARLSVSHDLHPAIRSILNCARKDDAEAAIPSCYRLTDKAANLLTGLYAAEAGGDAGTTPGRATRKRPLLLNLTAKAAGRLHLTAEPVVQFRLAEISFFSFRTGIGLAVIEIEIDIPAGHPAPFALLIEAAHLLSDERRQPWLSWPVAGTAAKQDRFRLSDLIQPLVADAGYTVMGGRRIFTYSTAVAASGTAAEACRETAFRLSRHYNDTYAPQIPSVGTEILEPFTNVVHALSLEGAASVVTLPDSDTLETGAPEFLLNWLDSAYRPTYLPLAIVAYHEHLALLEFAQSAAIDLDFDHLAEAQIRALQRLCHRFLAFRLRYRPAQASFITMHNEFSNALRRALGADALSQKAAQDAMEAEMRLSRHMAEIDAATKETARLQGEKRHKERHAAERKREKRWAWHGTLVACLLAILAVLNFTEQMSETPAKFIETGFSWSALDGTERIKLIGLAVAVICGLVGGYINWFRLQQGEVEDEVIEDAKKDQMMERSKAKRHTEERAKAE